MKSVYILGAGASMGSKRVPGNLMTRSFTMPSGKMFFRDAFHVAKAGPDHSEERYLNILGLTFPETTDFLADLWGLPRKYADGFEAWDNVNIEDMFSILDVATSSLPRGSRELSVVRIARRCLLEFIETTIWVRAEGQYCAYLEKLFSTLEKSDSIISFNWDTLADATLDRMELPQYFNYLKLMNGEAVSESEGTLMKLHGSTNWLACSNPFCKNHRKVKLEFASSLQRGMRLNSKLCRESEFYQSHKCELCGRDLEMCIIPPTSRKILDRGARIHQIWMSARRQLSEADKIVIIGYSLPRNDFHAEWLIRERELDAKFTGKKLIIEIVDPVTKDHQSELMKRYRSIFHYSGIDATYPDLKSYIRKRISENAMQSQQSG